MLQLRHHGDNSLLKLLQTEQRTSPANGATAVAAAQAFDASAIAIVAEPLQVLGLKRSRLTANTKNAPQP